MRPRGALAQLGERRLCKPEVTGSIPVRSIRERLAVSAQEADVATKKQKARAAVAGSDLPAKAKPKPKKKTSRGK
jgi:hypothetical protein